MMSRVLVAPNLRESVFSQALAEAQEAKWRRTAVGAQPWRSSPAAMATELSHGRWRHAWHLDMLSDWLVDAAEGRRPRIIVEVPPRHGKSTLVSQWFPVWLLSREPEAPVLLGSYEADFAAQWGRRVRNTIEEHAASLGVAVAQDSGAAHRWDTTMGGGMATAGVGGPMTGKGARALILDDPVKNAQEAESPTYRERTWDWWRSVAYTRLEPGGIVVIIMSRWHHDDLVGRIQAQSEEHWDVLRLPAIAEEDEPNRNLGDALWPERFPLERLQAIRRELGSYWFNALYQGRPMPEEGGMFKRHWFEIVDAAPARADRVRYWDKAGTTSAGDFSAGVLMARDGDGLFYIQDVARGQWSALARERVIRQCAELDGQGVVVCLEQEPGSGGKESAENSVRRLAGFAAYAETVTGSKETRARPFAAQAEAGNIKLVRGSWNADFLEELCEFPLGGHDDQVDATAGAFNKLALPPAKATVVYYDVYEEISPF